MVKRKMHRSSAVKKIKADMQTGWIVQERGTASDCIVISVLEQTVHVGLWKAVSAWPRHVDGAAEILAGQAFRMRNPYS